MSRELMKVEEVAEYLRVSVMTIRALRVEGRFAPAIKVGRRVLWDRDDLGEWIAGHKEAS